MAGPGKRGVPAKQDEDYEYLMMKARIMALKKANKSNLEIAAETGYEVSSVRKLVKRIVKETLDEAGAAEVRALELQRLEEITQRFWPKLVPADPTAIPNGRDILAYLNLSKAKRELVGADAPKKVKIDFGEDEAGMAIVQDYIARVEEYMDLADKIKQQGIGSGRPEVNEGDIVDGEIVEEEVDE